MDRLNQINTNLYKFYAMNLKNDLKLIEKEEIFKRFLTDSPYKLGTYEIDIKLGLLVHKGESVRVTLKEACLLAYFASHINVIITISELMDNVWGENSADKVRSMNVYICKIRKLISNDPKLILINVTSVGYRLLVLE